MSLAEGLDSSNIQEALSQGSSLQAVSILGPGGASTVCNSVFLSPGTPKGCYLTHSSGAIHFPALVANGRPTYPVSLYPFFNLSMPRGSLKLNLRKLKDDSIYALPSIQ